MPTPKVEVSPPEADRFIFFVQEPAYYVPFADTIAIGKVVEAHSPVERSDKSVDRDFVFEVENYVAKPLRQSRLTVRMREVSGGLPVKGTHLSVGEHLLLFLKKHEDHFALVGGVWGAKYDIGGNMVRSSSLAPWTPLDEVMASIKTVAETWSREELSEERRAEVIEIVLSDPSIGSYLAGREYEVSQVEPAPTEPPITEVHYRVSVLLLQEKRPRLQLSVVVNAARRTVEGVTHALSARPLTQADREEAARVALADPDVRQLVGNRPYAETLLSINEGSWQEKHSGRIVFFAYPEVTLYLKPLAPYPSDRLRIFVDLDKRQVVKVFATSWRSAQPLQATAKKGGFQLTLRLTKNEHRVGETAEAVLTLSHTFDEPIELSAQGGDYFNLVLWDERGDTVYDWQTEKYGSHLPGRAWTGQMVQPGRSITGRVEFAIPKAGELYVQATSSISAMYPGFGYPALGLVITTPYIVLRSR